MPSKTTGTPPTLVLLGAGAWAQRTATGLSASTHGTKIFGCAAAEKLPAILAGREVVAVVAQVTADTPVAPLIELAKQPGLPPLLVCADLSADLEVVLGIMGAGASGLVRDNDTAALTLGLSKAAVRKDGLGVDEALQTLAERIDRPLALVSDGTIRQTNRAFRQLFGPADGTSLLGRPLADLAAAEAVRPLQTLLARAHLLTQDDKTQERLRFAPEAGSSFPARITAAPIAIAGEPGLAIQLEPVGAGPDDGAEAGTTDLPVRTDERPALLRRLAVLADNSSAVERSAALAVAIIERFPLHRRRLGFFAATKLTATLADCLRAAAPAEGTPYIVGDDACAVLVEDVAGPELQRLRRRLAEAPSETDDPELRRIALLVGVSAVSPGAGTPQELLEHALVDAMPLQAETIMGPDTTDTMEPPESLVGIDTQPASAISVATSAALLRNPDASASLLEGVDDTNLDAGKAPQSGLSGNRHAGEGVIDDPLTDRIRDALLDEGFALALQPIVSLMGDSREHYSVLVRLRKPDGGLASAAEIIRTAAGSGRMADIDRWVIRSALQLLGQRRRSGDKAAFFISLSPELIADDHLLIWICDALREFNVRGSWLTFQLQEQHAVSTPGRWSDLAVGLREIKARICVNESGLLENPDDGTMIVPDFIKFAPKLAEDLSGDRVRQRRLAKLIRHTKSRGTHIVVTGVEDGRALNLLWNAGIEYVQGNYLQEPAMSLDLPSQATAVPPATEADEGRGSLLD